MKAFELINQEVNTSKVSDDLLKIIVTDLNLALKVINNIPIGIAIATDASCREIRHNETSAKFFRIKPWDSFSHSSEEALPLKMYHNNRRLTPEEMPIQMAAWQGVEVKDMEINYVWDDGFQRIGIVNVTPVFSDNGEVTGAIALIEDITEKRKLELELAEANKKILQNELESFIEAVNTIADPFAILDQHYCFKYMTPGFAAFYNMTPEKLIGKDYWEACPELVGSDYYWNLCKVMNERVPVRFEWKAIYSDGWFEDHFHPLKEGGIVLYCRDITVRKRTELALRQSEEKFQKIFRNSPDMMIILKARNFEIVEVNQRFVDLLGFCREELIGRCVFDVDLIWGSMEKQEIMDEFLRASTNNKELELVTKTGDKIITLISTDVINIEGDTCYLSVIKNITNEKRMESKIARFEQLHLIGEMAAGIGHEVRNPMTTVKGFLQLFREKSDFAGYRDRLSLMIDELDRANGIVTEFLALSKNKTSVQKKQQLNHIIKAVFPLLQADALKYDKYISLELGDIPDLMLDEKEIRQVIHNLVRNGLEAIEPGQFVKIKTYLDGTDGVLEVSDEGHGMDPDVLEKAGNPFFTTKEMGTGMGLPICFSIAERHNASIEMNSGPYGTTVFVRFKLG